MKETQSKILPNRIEHNTRGKKTLKTTYQVISTSILIISLGMAVILPFRKIAVGPALAAAIPGVPMDPVTLVNTTETFNFNTQNDPTDDSIDYTPDPDWFGTDTLTYEICDSTTPPDLDDCDQALVTIEVTELVVTSTTMMDTSQLLAPDIDLGSPTANDDDNVTVVENSWVNIDVLANDDFGPDGPGVGPITIVTPPTYGTATVNDGPRSPDPAGLAYLRYDPPPNYEPPADYKNKLLISDSEVDEIYPPNPAAYTGVNLFITDLLGALDSTLTTHNPPDVNITTEPSGVAYNPANGFLYFADDGSDKIHELNPGDDKLYNTDDDVITKFASTIFGSVDPSGIAFDDSRVTDHLIIVDEKFIWGEVNDKDEEVYDIDLGTNGTLDAADAWTHFDTTSIGIRNPEGIEFNPDNCTLFILSSVKSDNRNLIAETTIDGHLLRYLDITSLGATNPAGLAYAPPSGDPGENNLYIVARGVDNDPPPLPVGSPILLGDPSENDGKMFEVSFENNAPPFVDAGLDQVIAFPFFPNNALLDGTVTDGCSPEMPGVTTTWSVLVQPPGSTVIFGDDSAVDTTASLSLAGDYTLQLEANDGSLITTDEIMITVSLAVNQAPIVNAGDPDIITLPDSAILDGTVTDDGLPIPPGLVTTDWTKLSGPGDVTFGDKFAVDTTASFDDTPGVYVLRLTAWDGEATTTDEVTITVNLSALQNVWLPLVIKSPTNP